MILTVAGLELVIRLGFTTSVTEVNAEDETCKTTCALTGVPATVALAMIWSAPLLVLDFGVSTACAMPLAFVTRVAASNAVRPKDEVRLTTVPAPTDLPLESLTWIVNVTGNAAVILE